MTKNVACIAFLLMTFATGETQHQTSELETAVNLFNLFPEPFIFEDLWNKWDSVSEEKTQLIIEPIVEHRKQNQENELRVLRKDLSNMVAYLEYLTSLYAFSAFVFMFIMMLVGCFISKSVKTKKNASVQLVSNPKIVAEPLHASHV